ncbi:WD repeat-containing protein 43 [Cucurbita pepo subsp. pepo]|uniref:WD repeat-containing protein 43 n=1 Tax=Cucurbita pepo subsp. pepo TaxID=3664 RepID=UPI000C9D2C2C|nr:WD repeat-containing protein 43 [Cucurbita pepo subsp. pepo]
MASSSIRDLLTSFSPDLHLFAISSGDGRIKIWDTLKGQIQTEFADFFTTDSTSILTKSGKGHLSVDYKCMKWLSLEKKRKRKRQCSLLLLGTGSGDVMALDVAAGELKWKISDCHPGGVATISFPTHGSCIYTAGADGMLCEIDSVTGSLLRKFKASTKAISCISVSPDGKKIATAASQMKIFNCSDHKKIQKFSGHPGAVRCMVFTKDGKYILSSGVGERYIVVWSLGEEKKQSASCVLAMEHPAIFVDSRRSDGGGVDETALYVLAISEIGVCYLWYGQNLEELRSVKPTKVLISNNDISSKSKKRVTPSIYAAQFQGIPKSGSGQVFLAHGLLVKPSFQNVVVHSGTDITLNSSNDGILLPSHSVGKSTKGLDVQGGVVALDRANAEDALRPIPKVFDSQEKRTLYHNLHVDRDDVMTELVDSGSQVEDVVGLEDSAAVCLEDKLRSLGILDTDDHTYESILKSAIFKGIDLEANMSQKKLREAVLSLAPGDACKLLGNLVSIWQSRLRSGKNVLPWIYSLLLNHNQHILSQEQSTQILDSLFKITKSKETAVQPLLQLSGRLQLVLAQIERASANKTDQTVRHGPEIDGGESSNDEDEGKDDEEVDDVLYGEEEYESELSSDNEN